MPEKQKHKLNIFIVDDDIDFGESLAEVFEIEGHSCELATTGEEAVDRFLKHDFDITFMDVQLPGKNGVESFLEIHKTKPDARVIMMTGYSVEQLLDQAINSGAWGILHKPLNIEKALQMIAQISPSGVLIADDDPDFVDNLRAILERAGFKVYWAYNGQEALAHMQHNNIGVLVLDLRMPILNGLETYLELRRNGWAIPTIIVSGYSYEESQAIEKLRSMNVTGILSKPFDPASLLRMIDEMDLQRRKSSNGKC
jgi:two-component system response regulator HydG